MVEYGRMFAIATGSQPFPYQVRLAQEGLPQLLRAPKGAGKTAAAVLGWLYRRQFHPDETIRRGTPRRLVYCLPMRVLVEQTLEAIRGWLANLGLSEKVRVYQLMGGVLEEDWVRRPDQDAVLVGTMDMLLSRALNRGFAASRFRWPVEFGLLNNDCLWVLDEVQLMGNGLAASAQLAGLRRALGTAAPCPSLWMSATVEPSWVETVDHPGPVRTHQLTDGDRNDPRLAPRLTAAKELRELGRQGWPEDAVRTLLDLHRPRTLTLVICNTVRRARTLFEALRRARPEAEVRLLHSRFRPPDRRAAVEAAISSRVPDAGRIVVATQVVEAGVDVSAATLVTELAPWGSLVQRLGRCNRFGELRQASVRWVDLSCKEAAPYTSEELDEARRRLRDLEGASVSPQALETVGPGRPPRTTHVLRRIDLLDLFDTEPDLAGNDVDVSRFIRDDADVDVEVLWREWDGDEPPRDLARPTREELCPVPAGEVAQFLKKRKASGFVWDHLERRWRPVEQGELRPGMVVLLHATAGGYDPEVGWDPNARARVPEAAAARELVGTEEGLPDDPPEETTGAWVPLKDHLRHCRGRVEDLLAALGLDLDAWVRDALLTAALWHDVGKAHWVFQKAIASHAPAPSDGLWAKAPAGGRPRYERPMFRHELASALALLAAPCEVHGLAPAALDLAAYLVAAHHGKVRMAIRSLPGEKVPDDPARRYARGVWDGDELGPVPLDGIIVPRVALDLSVMEAGRGPDGRPSWVERTVRLRDALLLGPFRLGFLEALLRAADWAVSAEEAGDD